MTAANRGERIVDDQYPTPPRLCRKLLQTARERGWAPRVGRWLEPSAGSGNFVQAAVAEAPNATIHAVEIDADLASKLQSCGASIVTAADFLGYRNGTYDFVFGNPPYGMAIPGRQRPISVVEPHLRHGLSMLERGGSLFFVLRAGVFEAKERYELLSSEHRARHVMLLNPRPRFVGRGDSTPYAAVLWTQGYEGDTTFEVFRW